MPTLTDLEKEFSSCLSAHVEMLATQIGGRSLMSSPENLELAAAYIEYSFAKCGYVPCKHEFQVEIFDSSRHTIKGENIVFPSLEHTTRNIIAELRGTQRPDEILVVGAHYDSVFDCPAANDNGSGVAALIELARYFSDKPTPRTIRFVAFTNEEPPFFHTDKMGSYLYAKRCSENGEKIVGMVALETIGYYTSAPNSQRYPNPLLKVFGPDRGNFCFSYPI